MQYKLDTSTNPTNNESDCIVVGLFTTPDKTAALSPAAQHIDKESNGKLSEIIKQGDFTGALEQIQMLYSLPNINSTRVLLVGCGKQEEFDTSKLSKATKAACTALKNTQIKQLSFYLAESFEGEATLQAVTQIILAHAQSAYQLTDYKSTKADKPSLKKVTLAFSEPTKDTQNQLKQTIKQAAAIAKGMQLGKDLANHPGNVCTPSYLAKQAKKVTKKHDAITLDVLEEKDMKKLGMGSFLSVSKGSDEPGKMIILEYQGAADPKQAPIALVGKGITFDTGGISLKPGASMDEMKFDMGGAAAMLGTLKACAEMQLPINLVVVVAAAENMPSARASKPGDIVTSMSGKTIEVLNTDAEGRLVLCDALTYVGKYKPQVVIDAATLTGACIIALGHHISAVLSNDETLASELISAGNSINDRAWQLPMSEDYKKQLKSAFADLGNIGGRPAGTITAACFLSEFTQDYTWAHLDIAGTAWEGKEATGRPIPLLCQYLMNKANASN